ncbi:hypothetical protein V7S76_05595 [Aquirufa sp. ROCK2-A2]
MKFILFICFLLAIFDVKYEQVNPLEKKKVVLLIVDNSTSMKTGQGNEVLQSLKHILFIIKLKHPEEELKVISHTTQPLVIDDVSFKETNSSFQALGSKIVHWGSKFEISAIYTFSDFQISQFEEVFQLPYIFNLIPWGKITKSEKFSISIPKQRVISVYNEELLFPISVFGDLISKDKSLNLEFWVDNRLKFNKTFTLSKDYSLQESSFTLKNSQIGKHKIDVKLYSDRLLDQKTIEWMVVKERAKILGLSDYPHPDMGVINRVAKNLHLKIDWEFNRSKSENLNILIFGNPMVELPLLNKKHLLIINSDLKFPKSARKNFKLKLWDSQMAEGTRANLRKTLDSTVQSWLYQVFLQNDENRNVYYLKNTKVKQNEPLHLICEVSDSLKLPSVEFNLTNIKYPFKKYSYRFSPHFGINDFVIPTIEPGNYKYHVKDDQAEKKEIIGDLVVEFASPESVQGRNSSIIQYLKQLNNIKIVELKDLQSLELEAPKEQVLSKSIPQVNSIHENKWFWFWIIMLIFVEWLVRKKTGLL